MSDKMTMADVMTFAREKWLSVAFRGGASLIAVIGLLALYYAFAPRMEGWRQELAVTLETRGGVAVYPNERPFSSSDLLSAPVLNRVWQQNGLKEKVKFEDFCKWFALVGYDREKSKLDAEYQSKMAKRNITVTELSTLQREYEGKLAAREADNRYVLSMQPTVALSKDQSTKILASVPRAWFDEYSVLNAPKMPAMMRAEVLTAYAKRLQAGDSRSLEMVDALRLYVQEISATCGYIRDHLLKGRNVVVDGTDLGAYEARLELTRAEILRLKNRLLVDGDPRELENFVAARLDDMACETLAVEEKASAVKQTVELLSEMSGVRRGSPAKETLSSEGAVTLQADATFFQDFTAMVRRDANQASVQKYADELSAYRKELADIKARKLYYDQIGEYVQKTRERAAVGKAVQRLAEEVSSYTAELVEIGSKVAAFRNRCLQIYRTPDMFYALPFPVTYAKCFVFSVARLALGLLALWALYNLSCLALAWNRCVKTEL